MLVFFEEYYNLVKACWSAKIGVVLQQGGVPIHTMYNILYACFERIGR